HHESTPIKILMPLVHTNDTRTDRTRKGEDGRNPFLNIKKPTITEVRQVHIYTNKKYCIADKEATPDKPKKPDMTTVKTLMGTCNPIAPPNTLTKNKNNMPIPNFTVVCAINRIGFIGAPTNSNTTIRATIMAMTSVEFNASTPFSGPLLLSMPGLVEKEPVDARFFDAMM